MTETQKKKLDLSFAERWQEEQECWQQGYRRVAGFDEAGRGPLAGPVVAAAFIITPELEIPILNDSKKLTPRQRQLCYEYLTSGQWEYSIGIIEPAEIDRINIYQASRQAMLLALKGLENPPDFLLVDALTIPETSIKQKALIRGDARSHAIAAASVLAKWTRDSLMTEYDCLFPGYGFAKHKGYPTKEHYLALGKLGPTPLHRRSFKLTKNYDN